MEEKGLSIPHCQYHGCWLLGDARSQAISSNSIDLVFRKLYGSYTAYKGQSSFTLLHHLQNVSRIFRWPWHQMGKFRFRKMSQIANFVRIFQQVVDSLWPGDAIWQHTAGSTLAQVMACCLMAPSHYLNQCWLVITKIQWRQFHKPSITKIGLKMTFMQLNLPGASELILSLMFIIVLFIFCLSKHLIGVALEHYCVVWCELWQSRGVDCGETTWTCGRWWGEYCPEGEIRAQLAWYPPMKKHNSPWTWIKLQITWQVSSSDSFSALKYIDYGSKYT